MKTNTLTGVPAKVFLPDGKHYYYVRPDRYSLLAGEINLRVLLCKKGPDEQEVIIYNEALNQRKRNTLIEHFVQRIKNDYVSSKRNKHMSAKTFKERMMLEPKSFTVHHDCEACEAPVGYVIQNDHVFFDHNCDCLRYEAPLERRTWKELFEFSKENKLNGF